MLRNVQEDVRISCQSTASVDPDSYKQRKPKDKTAQITISEIVAITKTDFQFSEIFVRHLVSA